MQAVTNQAAVAVARIALLFRILAMFREVRYCTHYRTKLSLRPVCHSLGRSCNAQMVTSLSYTASVGPSPIDEQVAPWYEAVVIHWKPTECHRRTP